jgi:hypothetical protein
MGVTWLQLDESVWFRSETGGYELNGVFDLEGIEGRVGRYEEGRVPGDFTEVIDENAVIVSGEARCPGLMELWPERRQSVPPWAS